MSNKILCALKKRDIINSILSMFTKNNRIVPDPEPTIVNIEINEEPLVKEEVALVEETVSESTPLWDKASHEWMQVFDNIGIDVAEAKTNIKDDRIFVTRDSRRAIVSLFQMGVGITMDGAQGPQTNLAIENQQYTPAKIDWWDGKLTSVRSFGGNKPWKIDENGFVETSSQIRFVNVQPTAQIIVVNYKKYIKHYSEDLWPLIYATILTESSGKKDATRYEPHIDDSSYGLMQILSKTARGLGFDGESEALLDPEINITWGTELILRKLNNTRMDPILVAATYNAGGVYPSGNNPWGIRCYGNHLDKFAINYNAIVKVLGS